MIGSAGRSDRKWLINVAAAGRCEECVRFIFSGGEKKMLLLSAPTLGNLQCGKYLHMQKGHLFVDLCVCVRPCVCGKCYPRVGVLFGCLCLHMSYTQRKTKTGDLCLHFNETTMALICLLFFRVFVRCYVCEAFSLSHTHTQTMRGTRGCV